MPQRLHDGATCFVRNLPYDMTSHQLEEHFGATGPVKEAFVVQDKKTGKGRGIGFVSFSIAEDAERAVTSTEAYNGRKLAVDIAKNKVEAQTAKEQGTHKVKAAGPAKAKAESAKDKADTAAASGKAIQPAKSSGTKAKAVHRLIVRNLSFRCDEAALRTAFQLHGKAPHL